MQINVIRIEASTGATLASDDNLDAVRQALVEDCKKSISVARQQAPRD